VEEGSVVGRALRHLDEAWEAESTGASHGVGQGPNLEITGYERETWSET